MTDPSRDPGAGLLAGSRALIVVAAISNIGHTFDHAHRHGQDTAHAIETALLPDALLVLSMWRLARDLRSAWAWLGVTASVTFVSWACLSTTQHDLTARIIALVPIITAIIATGMAGGHGTRHATATHAPDQHVPSRVHVEAAVRVGMDRGHADHATPQLAATPPTPAPHVDPPTPRPAVEATPPTDPREAAYHAWLTDPTTWPVDRVERDFTLTRKAAGEQIRRWRQRAEREATPPGAQTLIRSSLDGPEAHE